MNWFKQKIRKWLMNDGTVPESPYENKIAIGSNGNSGALNSDPTMTFTVYSAVGGKVIEFRRYDRRTDRSDHTMYVISSDDDFGSRISKIATLESLKN